MTLIAVVLPEPFGPDQSEDFAGRDVEAQAVERVKAAEALDQLGRR